MDKIKNLWQRLITPQEIADNEARQEYLTRVIIAFMSLTLVVFSVPIVVGRVAGLYTPVPVFAMLILNVIVWSFWWFTLRGYWRVTRYFPIVLCFLLAFYGTLQVGLVTTFLLLHVTAFILAGILLGNKAQWFVMGLSIITQVVFVLVLDINPIDDVIVVIVPICAFFTSISLLQWLSTNQLEEAIENTRAFSKELVASNESLRLEIIEREQAQEALKESEERYRSLFNNVPVGLYRTSPMGAITDANHAMLRILGYPDLQSLLSVNVIDLYASDDDRRRLQTEMEKGVDSYSIESSVCRYHGTEIWIEDHFHAVYRPDGTIRYFEGSITDITERKRTDELLSIYQENLEELVEERTEELQSEIAERKQAEAAELKLRTFAEALADSAAILTSTLDMNEVFDRILENASRVVPNDAASIMLIDEDQMLGQFVREIGIEDFLVGETLVDTSLVISDLHNLTTMVETKKPYVVPIIKEDPHWLISEGREWGNSYVGAPLIFGDSVIGFIHLTSTTPGYYNHEHGKQLQAFANQASIAIRNARLFEKAGATGALEERQRLARDIHDVVSQTLFSASMLCESVLLKWETQPEKAKHDLTQLHSLTRGALAEMRSLLFELRPDEIAQTDLGALINQLVDGISVRTNIDISKDFKGGYLHSPEVQLTFFRISQEALNNIANHARASQVEIILNDQPDRIKLQIKDNGRGFDLEQSPSGRLGLNIMQERAKDIEAELDITSIPGKGTIIEVNWAEG
jgi:PAS domain S-box-containing protein